MINCGSLSDAGISELCRVNGVYPHHVGQRNVDFANGKSINPNEKNNLTIRVPLHLGELKHGMLEYHFPFIPN